MDLYAGALCTPLPWLLSHKGTSTSRICCYHSIVSTLISATLQGPPPPCCASHTTFCYQRGPFYLRPLFTTPSESSLASDADDARARGKSRALMVPRQDRLFWRLWRARSKRRRLESSDKGNTQYALMPLLQRRSALAAAASLLNRPSPGLCLFGSVSMLITFKFPEKFVPGPCSNRCTTVQGTW